MLVCSLRDILNNYNEKAGLPAFILHRIAY